MWMIVALLGFGSVILVGFGVKGIVTKDLTINNPPEAPSWDYTPATLRGTRAVVVGSILTAFGIFGFFSIYLLIINN
jgi:hypothetical protein